MSSRASILSACCAALLSACGALPAGDTSRLSYEAPSSAPPPPAFGTVAQDVRQARDEVLGALQASPLEIVRALPGEPFIVAVYGGDPQPWLDYGRILLGDGRTIPGSQSAYTARRWLGRRSIPVPVDRTLRLDARMVVTFTPGGAEPS